MRNCKNAKSDVGAPFPTVYDFYGTSPPTSRKTLNSAINNIKKDT